MSRRYLAVLATASALILVVGMMLRPKDAPEVVAPPAGESPLRQLSRDAQLRDQARLISDRVDGLAAQVLLLADGRPAVRWDAGSAIVTDSLGVPSIIAVSDSVPRADRADITHEPRWIVLVGRTPEDSIISIPGLAGGTAPVMCGALPAREIVMSQAITPALRGAGAYTMSGELAGVVVPCGDRVVVRPTSDLANAVIRPPDSTTAIPAGDTTR